MGRTPGRKPWEAYGLGELTYAEVARVLEIKEADLWMWIRENVPQPARRKGEWERGGPRHVPEYLIRFYLLKSKGLPLRLDEPESPVAPTAAPPPPSPPRTAARSAKRAMGGRRPA